VIGQRCDHTMIAALETILWPTGYTYYIRLGSRSFKVIDIGTTGKNVGSACYGKQQVCVYLQPFWRQMSQLWQKNDF